MQSQNHNLHFDFLEKRRLKTTQLHRNMRQQLFNKSRQIFQNDENNDEDNQDSSPIVESNNDNFFHIQQNQIKKGVQSLSLQNQSKQQTMQTMQKTQQKSQKSKRKHNKNHNNNNIAKKYAKMLQTPTWMNIVPQQLSKFYVMARPNGKAGLLVFKQGWFTMYDKFGKKMDALKCISDKQKLFQINKICKNLQGTVLQIVYIESSKQICITDLLCWKNNLMTAQNFEFRYAWLLSNSQNQLLNLCKCDVKISIIQYYSLESQQSLKKVYFQNFGYQKQGLLFIHKQSPYIHGINENSMIWKDFHTSKYPIDQPTTTKPEQQQAENKYIYGMGKLAKNFNIYSQDGFKLGHINPLQIVGVPQGFIRFRISGIEFKSLQYKGEQSLMDVENQTKDAHSGMNLILKNFQIIQYKKFGKLRADPLSRIIFQYRIRNDPLTIDEIYKKMGNKTDIQI